MAKAIQAMHTTPTSSTTELASPAVFTVDCLEPMRVDAFLAAQLGRSRAFVQSQIENQRIFINGKAISRASSRVEMGDKVSANVDETAPVSDLVPVEANLAVLYEDDGIVVINKPQGMVVHPAPGTSDFTLVHHLLHHLQMSPDFSQMSSTRPGIVHRLDRGTSGVILVGKTALTHERLAKQFHDRLVRKRYEAIVWGTPDASGTVSSSIGRSKYDRTRMSSRAQNGKPALTAWQRLAAAETFSHVALYPKTGRTHQLRVHLSDLGHPIVGDPTYRKSQYFQKLPTLASALRDQLANTAFPFLHAQAIDFENPLTGKRMLIEAPRPTNFQNFLKAASLVL
jgi:23S rRNA pseudouridine1911/1915/1917 synthase